MKAYQAQQKFRRRQKRGKICGDSISITPMMLLVMCATALIVVIEVKSYLLLRSSMKSSRMMNGDDVAQSSTKGHLRLGTRHLGGIANSKPPTILWMYWVKGLEHLRSLSSDSTNKYALDARCVEAWIKLNPNWDVRILDQETVNAELAPMFFSLMHNETAARRIPPRLQADLLRVELLSRYGGVWTDTSVCPFIPLDSFIPKWIGNPDGFFAPRLELSLSKSIQSAQDFPSNVTSCHDFKDTPKIATGFRAMSTWFLASASPHNPLVDEWLKVFHGHLLNSPDPRGPYYLSHCSLTQAIVREPAVESVWANTISYWKRSKMENPCFDVGGGKRTIASYWKDCAFVKKQVSTNLQDYVLSPVYMDDITLSMERYYYDNVE